MVEVEIKEQIQYIQKNTNISKEHTKKTVHTKSIGRSSGQVVKRSSGQAVKRSSGQVVGGDLLLSSQEGFPDAVRQKHPPASPVCRGAVEA